MTIAFDDPVAAQVIPELMVARRAFAVSQSSFARPVTSLAAEAASIGWFDTEVCAEAGAVAVVPPEGPLAALVGELVVVKRSLPTGIRGVYVYVVGRAPIPNDLAVSRRAFLELGVLATESLECSVEVVG